MLSLWIIYIVIMHIHSCFRSNCWNNFLSEAPSHPLINFPFQGAYRDLWMNVHVCTLVIPDRKLTGCGSLWLLAWSSPSRRLVGVVEFRCSLMQFTSLSQETRSPALITALGLSVTRDQAHTGAYIWFLIFKMPSEVFSFSMVTPRLTCQCNINKQEACK